MGSDATSLKSPVSEIRWGRRDGDEAVAPVRAEAMLIANARHSSAAEQVRQNTAVVMTCDLFLWLDRRGNLVAGRRDRLQVPEDILQVLVSGRLVRRDGHRRQDCPALSLVPTRTNRR